jgi:tRNA 5-methylaminomethyl-2-thiouridine biosynthesis bifunctional protein
VSPSLRHASIDWSQDTPFARDFDDIYFSRDGGADEAIHVFLRQNRLPERFSTLQAGNGFTVVETGFGTGLNWLATMDLWQRQASPGWLHYVSVEKLPLAPADLLRAHACWPAFTAFANALQHRYPPLVAGFHRLVFPEWRSTLTLFFGDIADFLPRLEARADAWFLDGFAPDRNPEMWTPALFTGMASLSKPGATFATFTAAGSVRRGLAGAGFAVSKVPGHGRKREMLSGSLALRQAALEIRPDRGVAAKPWLQRLQPELAERHACVIGAGIAGAQTAHRLALRGWKVTVLERGLPAQGASGNPGAVLYPRLAPPAQALDNFRQAAWLLAIRELELLPPEDSPWHRCGLLQLLTGNHAEDAEKLPHANLPAALVERLCPEEASRRAGLPLQVDALWYPLAGWLAPEAHIQQLLRAPGITLRTQCAADRLERSGALWHVLGREGEVLAVCPVVIVASAHEAMNLKAFAHLPLQAVRGQVSSPRATPGSLPLATLLCHDGYMTPALPDGRHCLGATFQPGRHDTIVLTADHEENRAQLREASPALADSLEPVAAWTGRAAVRCQSPDYLPVLGPIPDRDAFLQAYAGLSDGKVMAYPGLPVLPGLYANLAHGSQGFSQAALAAEILAAELDGEPFPVSRKVLDSLHPSRFWIREIRRRK